MVLPAVYRRKVGRDLAGAYKWYEEQLAGLGEEFLAAVDASFDAIEEFPQMFAGVYGEVRRAIVSCFPYAVFQLLRIPRRRFRRSRSCLRALPAACPARILRYAQDDRPFRGWPTPVWATRTAEVLQRCGPAALRKLRRR